MELTRVLIVDDSQLGREALEAVLSAHVEHVLSAKSAAEGLAIALRLHDLSLVVACVPLGHVDTDALVAGVVRRAEPRPRLILVEARPGELSDLRFADLGADGYLAKPIMFRDITRVLKRTQQGAPAEVAFRVRTEPIGFALRRSLAADRRRESSHVTWAIHDLSITGAFLESHGPLEVGVAIGLELQLPSAVIHAEAKVMRVQAPCWEHVAGIGVAFTSFAQGHEARLRDFIEERKRAAAAARGEPQRGAA
jgi:DNA-binding response OmpR family regulator